MQRWQKHILFWISVYITWMYMKTYGNIALCDIIINLDHVSAYMAIYYILRAFLIPRYYDQGKWVAFVLGILGSTAFVISIWYLILLLIGQFYTVSEFTKPSTVGGFVTEAIQMYVPGMLLLAWESHYDMEVEGERLHQLEKERIANELNYLKAQLNPQFLFNTLHNLKGYIDEKSPKAPDMILRLSEVLDYMLYKSQQDRLKLSEEIEVIQQFIDLENLRLGDRLHIDFTMDGDLSVDVAPLSLLSVVEYSLKESIINSHTERLHVDINILSFNERISCDVSVGKSETISNYLNGLSEIRKQLALTYPDRHILSQKEDDQAVHTSLTLMAAS